MRRRRYNHYEGLRQIEFGGLLIHPRSMLTTMADSRVADNQELSEWEYNEFLFNFLINATEAITRLFQL